MAINKTTKGYRVEALARKKLEQHGYLVERKPRSRFRSPDFYGLFDLLAIMGSTVRLIQVKSAATHFYTARKEIKAWRKETKVTIPTEVWLYEGRNKWRVEEIS